MLPAGFLPGRRFLFKTSLAVNTGGSLAGVATSIGRSRCGEEDGDESITAGFSDVAFLTCVTVYVGLAAKWDSGGKWRASMHGRIVCEGRELHRV